MAQPTTYAFSGGLDQVSKPLAVPAGRVVAALNYEPLEEGYGRVDGFERCDGRLPSETSFSTLAFDQGGVAIEEGDTIEGATSGATAHVLIDPVDTVGTWGASTKAGTLVLVHLSGTFQDGEVLLIDGVSAAAVDGTLSSGSAASIDREEEWSSLAREYLRSLVGKVPGSGPVRGGFVFDGAIYAVRDNADGTTGRIYKATPAGWALQSFGRMLPFTAGQFELAPDMSIIGATSGAEAFVLLVVKRSGSWGTDAAGYLILRDQIGTFGAEAIKFGTSTFATIGGNSSPIGLPAGGRYDFKIKNFYGASNRKRIYGINGVGTAFEYDGASMLVPILTGMASDTPHRLFEIGNALGLCFPGGSVQISPPGEPINFTPVLGASEIAVGDDVTDVKDANDSAVIIFTREKVLSLTGRDEDSFQLEELTEEAGADAWTVQRIGRTVYLDRRGLRDLTATSAFGNFKAGALSELFQPYLRAKRRAGAAPVASLRSKDKTHYRLFWSDKSGFSVFMGRKVPEMLPFSTGDMQVFATFTGELGDGTEGLFAGGEDGYLYRLDSGDSFDGEAIRGFVMTPYTHLGSIAQDKRYHGVTVEMQAAPRTRISVTGQFDYGDGQQPISGDQDFTVAGGGHDFIVQGGGGVWDVSVWNEFYWDAAFAGTADAYLDGFGRNISLIMAATSGPVERPHVLQAYTIHWTPGGETRRRAG